MQYQIDHTTTYRYSQPTSLEPHTLRLYPRTGSFQTLRSFSLQITPAPVRQSHLTDLDGNVLVKLWFDSDVPTESLRIAARSHVETLCTNPFDYLLEPWAVRLPIDYPASLLLQLQPYLVGQQVSYGSGIDPIAVQLAQEVCLAVDGNVTAFLTDLTQRIYSTCKYTIRETGDPLPAGVTWLQRTGSCRDFAVLFVEACRAIGLAARFVSGYQEGDPDSKEYHLHAWAEVYLPGAGWRGFDPTQGLAVADRHIALAASPVSRSAAAIVGSLSRRGSIQSTMTYDLAIQRIYGSKDEG